MRKVTKSIFCVCFASFCLAVGMKVDGWVEIYEGEKHVSAQEALPLEKLEKKKLPPGIFPPEGGPDTPTIMMADELFKKLEELKNKKLPEGGPEEYDA